MAGKLSVGIVGASVQGSWSTRSHIPGLAVLPDAELKAVATTRQETADASAYAFGAEFAFGHYSDMLARDDIDLISVVVRVPAHYDLTMAAIISGRNVYCEWPLGANLREAEEMALAAASRRVLNVVGLQGRGDPELNYMKQLLVSGYVGEVLACNVTYLHPGILSRSSGRAWQRDKSKGANTFTILAGHALDCLTYAVGQFTEVSARLSTQVKQWRTTDTNEMLDVSSPDNVLLSGVLKNGAVASVHIASVPFFEETWRIDVLGREGALALSGRDGPNIGPSSLKGVRGDGPLIPLSVPNEYFLVPEGLLRGPAFNVAQLYAAIVHAGKEPPFRAPTFADALENHRLLDSIQKSSDQGRAISVE